MKYKFQHHLIKLSLNIFCTREKYIYSEQIALERTNKHPQNIMISQVSIFRIAQSNQTCKIKSTKNTINAFSAKNVLSFRFSYQTTKLLYRYYTFMC